MYIYHAETLVWQCVVNKGALRLQFPLDTISKIHKLLLGQLVIYSGTDWKPKHKHLTCFSHHMKKIQISAFCKLQCWQYQSSQEIKLHQFLHKNHKFPTKSSPWGSLKEKYLNMVMYMFTSSTRLWLEWNCMYLSILPDNQQEILNWSRKIDNWNFLIIRSNTFVEREYLCIYTFSKILIFITIFMHIPISQSKVASLDLKKIKLSQYSFLFF